MESYQIIYPSPILSPYVKHYWILETDSHTPIQQRVIPTGCIQIIFYKEGKTLSSVTNDWQPRSFIGGQTTRYMDLSYNGKIHMIAVTFYPHSARIFFEFPIDKLYAYNISVDEIENPLWKELNSRIMDEKSNPDCIRLLEEHLIRCLYRKDLYMPERIKTAVNYINKTIAPDMESLSACCCLSEKQFNRRFNEYVGINPKKFLRIVRFQRALHYLQNNPDIDQADLIFSCGFYDQSHMIKEFKSFSGYTPTEYIKVCAPVSDYFQSW